MRIVSVNVGTPRQVQWKNMVVSTGIFKQPVDGLVAVRRLNLAGDRQADLSVHGGLHKAVYGYPVEHYEHWRSFMPEREFPFGVFGENLTTEGLREDALNIGDRLKIGSAVLMVTQPRVPCYKLALRFNSDAIIAAFLFSGRSGFYFSVVEEGELKAGDDITIVHRDPNGVTVADINRLYVGKTEDLDLRRRAASVDALPDGWKSHLLQASPG